MCQRWSPHSRHPALLVWKRRNARATCTRDRLTRFAAATSRGSGVSVYGPALVSESRNGRWNAQIFLNDEVSLFGSLERCLAHSNSKPTRAWTWNWWIERGCCRWRALKTEIAPTKMHSFSHFTGSLSANKITKISSWMMILSLEESWGKELGLRCGRYFQGASRIENLSWRSTQQTLMLTQNWAYSTKKDMLT